MSRDVPDGWAVTTFGKVGSWVGGGTPSKANPDFWLTKDIPWVSPKDVKSHQISDAEDWISFEAVRNSATNVVQPGTILFVTRSGILRHTLPVARAMRDVAINQDIKALKVSGWADVDFVFHYARHSESAILSKCVKSGTTVESVDFQALKDFSILLPPLAEQRRIAEILSSVDEAIQATEAVIEQTRKVKDGVLERLLTKGIGHTEFKDTEIGTIPADWAVGPISSYGKVHTGKTPSTARADYWDGPIPFITPGDLSDKVANVEQSNRSVTQAGAATGRILEKGAVLVTCIGSTIGKVGIAGTRCLVNQQINAISCNPETSNFVYALSSSLTAQLKNLSGKQAVPIVNKGTFEAILVPLPPRDEQLKIGAIAASFEAASLKSKKRQEALWQLKGALMSDLLTGRKRVADAVALAAE